MPFRWRRWLFYSLVPLLLVMAGFSVHFKTDLSAFLIAGENADEILLASEMQSGALSKRYILSIDAGEGQVVAPGFVAQLLAQLQQIEGVEAVWSPGQVRAVTSSIQRVLLPHAAQMYSLNPQSGLQSLLSDQGLQQRAAMLKKAVLSPQASLIKTMALQDPLLLTLNSLRSRFGQMQQLIAHNPRYQNLILQTLAAGLDVPAQRQIQQHIRTVFGHLNVDSAKSYQLDMTGVPVFAEQTQRLITGDVIRISLLSSIALSLLFLGLFRSFSTLLQVAVMMLAVVAAALLITQSVFGFVHAMTLAIGTTLIGICIDYPIHAVVHAQGEDEQQRVVIISGIWPSIFLGGATTLIGYLALGLSGYPGFQQIAVYAGSGILLSLMLTRYVLPSILTGKRSSNIFSTWLNAWMNFCERRRTGLRIGLILLMLGALSSFSSLHWMQDLQQLTPELDALKALDQRIRQRMISSIEPGRFILISGKDVETVLQKAEQVYVRLDKLQKQGALSDYIGLYPWLLSKRQQQQNENMLLAGLTVKVRNAWRAALIQQGLAVNKLADLPYAVSEPLMLKQLLASPLQRLIDNQIIISDQQTLCMIWLAKHQPQAVREGMAGLSGVQYFSQRDLLNRMAVAYQQRAQITLMLGLGVIVLLLLMRYKSLLLTLQTLLPALSAALFILAGWAITGQAISFLHLVGFLLAVAICVDYGIFFQENRAGNLLLTYQAMAASMLTSALAFGSLAVAKTEALQTLAQVVALGVILGFLLCPIIIRHTQKIS